MKKVIQKESELTELINLSAKKTTYNPLPIDEEFEAGHVSTESYCSQRIQPPFSNLKSLLATAVILSYYAID